MAYLVQFRDPLGLRQRVPGNAISFQGLDIANKIRNYQESNIPRPDFARSRYAPHCPTQHGKFYVNTSIEYSLTILLMCVCSPMEVAAHQSITVPSPEHVQCLFSTRLSSKPPLRRVSDGPFVYTPRNKNVGVFGATFVSDIFHIVVQRVPSFDLDHRLSLKRDIYMELVQLRFPLPLCD